MVDLQQTEPHKLVPALDWGHLVFALLPMLFLLVLNYLFRLALGVQIAISTVRSTLQLTIIGFILVPVFEQGLIHPWVAFLYTMLMVLIAAFEATSRPKYLNKFAFLCVWGSIVLVVGVVSMYMSFLIVKPDPWWDPRVIIPTCGMMLGNTVTSVGLSLNSLLTTLFEQTDQVEILLSMGATKWEACRDATRDALRTGLMPTLNNMAVIGVVSIPGMMTGEILGGSSPEAAARYQLMIILLISVCNFLVATVVCGLTLFMVFDSSDRLLCHMISEQRTRKRDLVLRLFDFMKVVIKTALCVEYCCQTDVKQQQETESWVTSRLPGSNDEASAPLLDDANGVTTSYNTHHGSSFAVYQLERTSTNGTLSSLEIQNGTLQVVKLSQPRRTSNKSSDSSFLFQNQSFRATPDDIVVIMGPSGCGKTTMLRQIANLDKLHTGTCKLGGKSYTDMHGGSHQWRKTVRYVCQNNVNFTGTPTSFIERVGSLKIYAAGSETPHTQILSEAVRLAESWGVAASRFDRSWVSLSAGESQRVMLAIHLATRPKVLLLDEPTSALDSKSKSLVESALRSSGIALVWITHDQDQATRLGTIENSENVSHQSNLSTDDARDQMESQASGEQHLNVSDDSETQSQEGTQQNSNSAVDVL